MSKRSKKAAKSNPKASQAPVRREPTAEEIRQRAYEIFLRRGGAPGRDVDDWMTAERELRGS